MFGDVTEVKELGARVLILSGEDGQKTKFIRSFTNLSFVSSNIQIETHFEYSSAARTPDGNILYDFHDIADYIESKGQDVEHQVQSVNVVTSIKCDSICRDNIYVLENKRPIAKIGVIIIEFMPAEKTRVELFLSSGGGGKEKSLILNVFCEDEQFQMMLGYLGFSSIPASVEVSVSAPCFQPDTVRSDGADCTDLVLESGMVKAQLEDIRIHRTLPSDSHLPSSVPSVETVPAHPSGFTISDELSAYADDVARSVLRMEIIVGFTAAVLLASAILTWF